MKYHVVRRHEGDRWYEEGEIREGNEADLRHLVPKTLQPMEGDKAAEKPRPAAKMETEFPNKAEGPVANKAEMPAADKAATRRNR